MFAIHSLSGRSLRGPLEELAKSPEARRLRRNDTEYEPAFVVEDEAVKRYREAAAAYESLLPKALERGPVKHAWQLMSRRLISVLPEDSIEKAWKTLIDNHVRQALVVDTQRTIQGLVSDRELLTALNIESNQVCHVLSKQVKDLMTTPVVSADPVTDIRRIAQALLDYKLSGLPIVEEGGAIVGFISRGDILRSVINEPPLSLWI